MGGLSRGLKWDRRKLTQPCFGVFLPGSVKNTTIANGFVAVASMAIFGGGILEHIHGGHYAELSDTEHAIRPWFWVAYYLYWLGDIYLSIVLYAASKSLNLEECKKWLSIQVACLIVFFILFSLHCYWLTGFSYTLRVLLGVLGCYKLYTIWVVYCFMKWVRGKNQYVRDVISKLSEEDLDEFERGNTSNEGKKRSGRIQNPYDRLKIEINMVYLSDRETWVQLSKTDFSTVYKARYVKPGHEQWVAVKVIEAEKEFFKIQLCEFKIRTEIGNHENIVRLIGANTSKIRDLELELITEFCPLGNLELLLQNAKMLGKFVNQVDRDGKFRGNRERKVSNRSNYSFPLLHSPIQDINTIDLIRWALHIAKGMAYLHEMKIIHGDLAVRNVLLSAEKIAKINDFGLSKECFSYSGYVRSKQKQVPLPWRSMAPECFDKKKLKSSFEGDVWAFGVTLWELFTLGDTPYAYLHLPNERFFYGLRNGMNPGRPSCAPTEVYNIMQSCWNVDPKKRMTFKEIVNELEGYLESLLRTDKVSPQMEKCSQIRRPENAVVVTMPEPTETSEPPTQEQDASNSVVQLRPVQPYVYSRQLPPYTILSFDVTL